MTCLGLATPGFELPSHAGLFCPTFAGGIATSKRAATVEKSNSLCHLMAYFTRFLHVMIVIHHVIHAGKESSWIL